MSEHWPVKTRVRCVADGESDPRRGTIVGLTVGEHSRISYYVRWDGETNAHPFAAGDLARVEGQAA